MIDAAINVTARALEWLTPDQDDGSVLSYPEDAHSYAIGFGGHYAVAAPKVVPLELIDHAKAANCVVIDGAIHFKAMLWWAHEPFTFAEFDSVEAAQLAAEADWQTRFRELIASAPSAARLPANPGVSA